MHVPVLKDTVVKLWGGVDERGFIKKGLYIDGTFGEGGHSVSLLEYPDQEKGVKVVGLDRDPKRIEKAQKKYKKYINQKKLLLFNSNFSALKNICREWQRSDQEKLFFRGILFDFGICSTQLEELRGFSFQEKEAPLDMRFDQKETLTAAQILNEWPEAEIERILREKGEERYSRKIARAIREAREENKRFEKVKDLLAILEKKIAWHYRKQSIHYATRTFQALRMTVNREEENIEKGLLGALETLDSGGRIVVVSFHSGEDRIVKNFFRRWSRRCICPSDSVFCECDNQPKLRLITKKPIVPDEKEVTFNSRSRSAKLRAASKL